MPWLVCTTLRQQHRRSACEHHPVSQQHGGPAPVQPEPVQAAVILLLNHWCCRLHSQMLSEGAWAGWGLWRGCCWLSVTAGRKRKALHGNWWAVCCETDWGAQVLGCWRGLVVGQFCLCAAGLCCSMQSML